MTTLRILLSIIALMGVAVSGSAATPTADPITVFESKFGVVFTAKDKAPRVIRGVEVPNIEGTAYGWLLRVKKTTRQSEITEILRMPAPAMNVNVNAARTSLSKDGKSLTTRIDVNANEEIIANFWTIAADDPVGPYSVEVRQAGKILARFDFDIVKKTKEEVLRSTLEVREREFFARTEDEAEPTEAGPTQTLRDCEKATYDRACLIANAVALVNPDSSGVGRVLEYYGRERDPSARRLMTLTKARKSSVDGYGDLEPLIHASAYLMLNGNEKAATAERDRFVAEMDKGLKLGSFSNKADNIILYCAAISSSPKSGASLWEPVFQKYCNLKRLDEISYGLDSQEKSFLPLLKAIVAAFEKNEDVYKENIIDALKLVDSMRRYATTSLRESGDAAPELKYQLDRYYIFLARASYYMNEPEVAARVLVHVNQLSEELPSLSKQMDVWIDLRTETAMLYLRRGQKDMAKDLVASLTKIAENKRFRSSAAKAFAAAAVLRQRVEMEEARAQPQKGPDVPKKGETPA
jgi:hypothetical protein